MFFIFSSVGVRVLPRIGVKELDGRLMNNFVMEDFDENSWNCVKMNLSWRFKGAKFPLSANISSMNLHKTRRLR